MIQYNDGSTLHNANLERPRTDVRISGNLAAVNAEILLALNGETTASVDLRGTFVGTFVIEATKDGSNYVQLPFFNPLNETFGFNLTVAGLYEVPNVAAYRIIKLRCSAYTSGLAIASINGSIGTQMVYQKPIPTTATLTTTAAISTGVTLTVPAAGTGLFHYITRLRISKYVGATLTAAATPTIATTTNLNNSPSFDFKTLGALGDSEIIEVDFTGNPLKSATANTATTIVCPVLTGAIWKITAFYYVGA